MIKRVLYLLIGAMIVLAFASSYKVMDLSNRAIVLGIAVDLNSEDEYNVTAEIITPQSTGDASSAKSGSRLLVGRGETIAEAFADMYKIFGRMPSLGQCSILLVGEDVYTTINMKEVLNYFYLSDAFADNTLVSLSEGRADEIFNKKTPLDSYISFSLQTISQVNGKKTSVPSNILQFFMEEQLSKSQSSFLNVVSFKKEKIISQDEPSEESKEDSGSITAGGIAVFTKGRYRGQLSQLATKGYFLIEEKFSFATYIVNADAEDDSQKGKGSKNSASYSEIFADKTTLGVLSKKVNVDYSIIGEKVQARVSLNVKLRRMRTDTGGEVFDFLPKYKLEVTEKMKKQVIEEMQLNIAEIYNQAKELDCDFLGIATQLYKKTGNKYLKFVEDNGSALKNTELIMDIKIDS